MLRLVGTMIVLLSVAASAASDDGSAIYITSKLSSGPGSIREAIEKANASSRAVSIVSSLEPGSVVYVFRELPALTAYGTVLDAAGMTLKGGTCRRSDGRSGCSGLVISGPRITVRRLSATGFTFDGIAVRNGAMEVRIEECRAYENQDDGIGISSGATDVVVEKCVLEKNGFRTKGKGILVFDYAEAVLRENTIRLNRDGVTVSRGARAELYDNTIADNYDKGLGVIGAEASGSGNLVLRNGLSGPQGEGGPNGDGLRVTSDSTVSLEDTAIAENGDVGVVVLGLSRLVLTGGRIAANGGVGVNVRDQAVAELRGVAITSNGKGEFALEGDGKLVRSESAQIGRESDSALPSPR